MEEIIDINGRVIDEIKVSKGDRHRIGELGMEKLRQALKAARKTKGDAYTKAAILMVELTIGHPFDSANRRTAYVAAREFLIANGYPSPPVWDIEVVRGIRYGTHKRREVEAWLKGLGRQEARRRDTSG
jgi:prophage maintenance system killer protein